MLNRTDERKEMEKEARGGGSHVVKVDHVMSMSPSGARRQIGKLQGADISQKVFWTSPAPPRFNVGGVDLVPVPTRMRDV